MPKSKSTPTHKPTTANKGENKGTPTSQSTGKRGRVENLRPWKKGQSGNPKGAPRRGESWAELIKLYGEMTPGEAAQQSLELAKKLLTIGEGVTLKEAVVLRVYAALLFEPDARLLNAFMDRAEGKVTQPHSMEPSKALLEMARKLGLPDDVIRTDPILSALFAPTGLAAAVGPETAGADSAEQGDN